MAKKGFAGHKERKRGKKKSQQKEDEGVAAAAPDTDDHSQLYIDDTTVGQSIPPPHSSANSEVPWIRDDQAAGRDSVADPVAPFGFVDSEIKTYFKDIHQKLKDAEVTLETALTEEDKKSGEHSLLLQAVIREVDGKELILATDPDTSVILEYMISFMQDKMVRVLMDRMMGNLATIARHRYGSHVLQTTLVSLQAVVSREAISGGVPIVGSATGPDGSSSSSIGVLRTAITLILDASVELSPDLSTLMQDAFATHIVRVLLLILSGEACEIKANSAMRSKRSAQFRSKAESAAMAKGKAAERPPPSIPVAQFADALRVVRQQCLSGGNVGTNEIRALAVSPISSPTLSVLIKLEAPGLTGPTAEVDEGRPNLFDILLDGLYTASLKSTQPSEIEGDAEAGGSSRSAFVETMLRDPIGTHVLQTLIESCPPSVVAAFHGKYIDSRLVALAVHPLANFVIASHLKKLGYVIAAPAIGDVDQSAATRAVARQILKDCISEMKAFGTKIVKEKKVAILQALLEGAAAADTAKEISSESMQDSATAAIIASFGWPSTDVKSWEDEEKREFLKVVLSMSDRKDWKKKQARDAAQREKKKAETHPNKKSQGKKKKDQFDVGGSDDDTDSESDEDDDAAAEPATDAREDDVLLSMEMTTQGSVLLQALARVDSPWNNVLHQSIQAQKTEDLLGLCRSAVAVHVILMALHSTATTFQQRRALLATLTPHLPTLSDDRWGSRVADTIWDCSDPFIKDRIVKILRPQETKLLASQYGRFLMKRLNLGLHRKDTDKWKVWAKDQPKQELTPAFSQLARKRFEAKADFPHPPVETASGPQEPPASAKRKADSSAKDAKKKKQRKDPNAATLDDILSSIK